MKELIQEKYHETDNILDKDELDRVLKRRKVATVKPNVKPIVKPTVKTDGWEGAFNRAIYASAFVKNPGLFINQNPKNQHLVKKLRKLLKQMDIAYNKEDNATVLIDKLTETSLKRRLTEPVVKKNNHSFLKLFCVFLIFCIVISLCMETNIVQHNLHFALNKVYQGYHKMYQSFDPKTLENYVFNPFILI